jgi:metal-responsive CopG/Arc/MetJ family transcriptional regulator
MPTHTIKVTGVNDELLRLLDERVQAQHVTGRSEYIRELIRRDVLAPTEGQREARSRGFREILAPVHAAAPANETEEEIEEFVDDLIALARRERRQRRERLPDGMTE